MTNSRRHVQKDVPYVQKDVPYVQKDVPYDRCHGPKDAACDQRDRRAGPLGPAGTTLIEVLVATLVMVSGVVAIAQLFLIAAATNAAARDTTVAATLAAQKVEELLSTNLADAAGSVDHVDRWGRVVGTSESPPPGAIYTRRWSIEPLTVDAAAIRVRVGRSDRSGRAGRMAGETSVLAVKTRPRS